jgi:hypothetical protein
MNIDKYVRWLSRVTLAVAVIMIAWGSSVLLGQPVTAWFAASTTIWMALLLIRRLAATRVLDGHCGVGVGHCRGFTPFQHSQHRRQ